MEYKDNKKIVLPEKLQINMLKFFLRTSIPRNTDNKELLSKIKRDRGLKNEKS